MVVNRILLYSASAIGLLTVLPASVAAQSDDTETRARGGEFGQDIIVTAQKREERLSDVGLTISALGESTLRQRSVQSLSDIANQVPGLTYTNSANNTPIYTLRGVGFFDTSLGSYPTTSVYLDQVALPFPVLTNLTAFDLQRIEVLKGPQGTLFGQNSTGGAINYIANKPTDSLTAGFDLSYGRFNDVVANAYVSGPLAEGLRARLAGRFQRSDDWQYSYTRPGDTNGRAKNWAARLLLDWDVTDNFSLELNLNAWHDMNNPVAVQYSAFVQQDITNVGPELTNYPFAPEKSRAADWSEENGMFRDLRFEQASLRADWEFVPDVTLTSITSYIIFDQDGALDQDGVNLSDVDLRFFYGHIRSFSQELRLANSGTSRLRWVIGGNFSRDTAYYRENLGYAHSSASNNQAPPMQIESSENWSDQRMKNYAVFGDVNLDVIDGVTLKAGARYTKAKRTANICNVDGTTSTRGRPSGLRDFPAGGANRLFTFLSNLLAPGMNYPDILPNGCFNLNDPDPLNPMANPDRPYEPLLFTNTLTEDNLSWRAGVDFKPSEDLLIYANLSRGYKAGGYGNINAATNVQLRAVRQESILNYEGGFKAQFADRRVSVEGAAFYMKYKNKQLRTKNINPIFGIIDVLENVPKSHIWGFEMNATANPVDGLSLGATAVYLNSKIDEYIGINAGGQVDDFKDTVIPFTPKWQLGGNLRYEVPVADSLRAFAAGQVSYRTSTFATIGGRFGQANTATDFAIPSYTLVDAQVGLTSDAGWRVMVWGKNLTGSYYWNNVVAGQDTIARWPEKPTTYGITVGYDF